MNSLQNKKIIKNLLFLLICIVIILGAYELGAYLVDSKFILPKLSLILDSILNLLGKALFWENYLLTLFRTLIAFVSSLVISIILNLLSRVNNEFIKKFVNLILKIIRALPTIAVTLVILLWSSSYVAPIIVSSLVILPALYTGISSAIENFDNELVEMMKVYKVDKKNIIKVYIKEISPKIAKIISSNFSLNLKLMVAGEVLAFTSSSIGGMMNKASLTFEMPELLALTILIVITAIIIESCLDLLIKKVWKGR